MDPTARILSSRAGARPISSGLPLHTARPITSTGLVAPKTSRGKSALRRQVQDKSYWLGVIRAKMHDLRAEIGRLSKECDQMSREESKIGVWQKKAESLARELNGLSQELTVYNEFIDRVRTGDAEEDIREEIEDLKEDNAELSAKLEASFEEKKRRESQIKNFENEIEVIEKNWNNLRRSFSVEQRERFEDLDRRNKELTIKSEQFEEEINKWKEKKAKLEEDFGNNSDSFSRKEAILALNKLRSLEQHRNELKNQSSGEDERGRLLAQVKRDNGEIVSLEAKIAEMVQEISEVKAELEDTEAIERYRELKKKEDTIEEFLSDFEPRKTDELDKLKTYRDSINRLVMKTSKYLSHIETLRSSGESAAGEDGTGSSLVDEKRKLELDLSKIERLETKINMELESLRNKMSALEKDIETYSDIPKLKEEMEAKVKALEKEKYALTEKQTDLRIKHDELKEKHDNLVKHLEENEIYRKIKNLETRLADLVASNAALKQVIDANDNSHLKNKVLSEVKKYNQRLLGY